jgi:glycosyltransferase involved in cell wall biosynthesis
VAPDGEPDRFSLILVCSSYPPVVGGSEVEAQRVCGALIAHGHRVTVATTGGPRMPPLRRWTDPAGVPVRLYAASWNGVMKDVMFALAVAWLLIRERRNYQTVYFLMQGLHLAAGLPVARLLGKTILMKVGGSGVLPGMARTPTGRLEIHWLRKWAARVMILNEGMRAEALATGLPADRLVWMPNPVDTERFSPASEAERSRLRAQHELPPHAFVIIYTGRLAREKSLHLLLEAFAIVCRQRTHAYLVLVGDGPMRATLEAQARRLGCHDSTRFIGSVDPSQVPQWLQMADVFALVSLSEGFPCALVEAMSVGLASVVSDISANQQLVQSEKHGLLPPAGDVPATAEALIRLLEDHELRSRLGAEARRTVEARYATERVLERYESLLSETRRTPRRSVVSSEH